MTNQIFLLKTDVAKRREAFLYALLSGLTLAGSLILLWDGLTGLHGPGGLIAGVFGIAATPPLFLVAIYRGLGYDY